jgi:hypothetical protein
MKVFLRGELISSNFYLDDTKVKNITENKMLILLGNSVLFVGTLIIFL